MAEEDHQRGASRPMQGGGDYGAPYSDKRYGLLRKHHQQVLWIPWSLILIGVWLLLSPATFGHLNPELWVDPAGDRGVWFGEETHTALRARLMVWSDVVSGVVLLFFGWRTLRANRPVSWWICCGIGVWLTLAPVLFWAPTAASYTNDTAMGMLLICLTILVPGMPNMPLYMKMGQATPPGWSYNPSSWPQRWIMIATGFLGFVVSRYLAAYQLGYLDAAWDPFFGDGSRRVLESDLSRRWPISDAGLGAVSYTFEFLMGFMGSPSRWRTMPWMVTFFGVLVIPLGLVHILLVVSQPIVVGSWCTLCLLAAAIMLPMIPLEVDEVVAMGQHVRRAHKRGDGSLWNIFWKGGSAEASTDVDEAPPLVAMHDRPGAVLAASVWGMSGPWTLALCCALGLAVMVLPVLVDVPGLAGDVYQGGGALIIVVSVIAMGEVVRAFRWLNVPLGLTMVIVPWTSGDPGVGVLAGTALVVAAMICSAPSGSRLWSYGSWDRFIR